MLTGQTGLPPNQPTGPKVKNVHNFGIFQNIWMKLGMQSLNGRTHHVYLIYDMEQNLGKKFFQSLLDQFFASNSPL